MYPVFLFVNQVCYNIYQNVHLDEQVIRLDLRSMLEVKGQCQVTENR